MLLEIMKDHLLDSWRINCKINLKLLDSVDDDGLKATLSPRGRNVAQQVAHLHNVRLMWLEVIAKDRFKRLNKIEKENANDKKLLKKCLDDSSKAMEELFSGADEKGKIKGYQKDAINLLSYFIAHEAHHRGNILLTLKQTGHKIDRQLLYDIWEWTKL